MQFGWSSSQTDGFVEWTAESSNSGSISGTLNHDKDAILAGIAGKDDVFVLTPASLSHL
jgi:hypothetical protein